MPARSYSPKQETAASKLKVGNRELEITEDEAPSIKDDSSANENDQ